MRLLKWVSALFTGRKRLKDGFNLVAAAATVLEVAVVDRDGKVLATSNGGYVYCGNLHMKLIEDGFADWVEYRAGNGVWVGRVSWGDFTKDSHSGRLLKDDTILVSPLSFGIDGERAEIPFSQLRGVIERLRDEDAE